MSITNYALGAKQKALEAQTQARPEFSNAQTYTLRRGQVTASNGTTSTVVLLDDHGGTIKDANGDPITITRVGRFPAQGDPSSVLLLFDSYGNAVIIQSGGGSNVQNLGMITE